MYLHIHTHVRHAILHSSIQAGGGAVFNASHPLVRVDVPELLVLYGCRQALARLVSRCVYAGAVWSFLFSFFPFHRKQTADSSNTLHLHSAAVPGRAS